MKVIYPDYNNCLVNLSNSILKFYGVNTYHNTLREADEALAQKSYKNVVLILYDGLGSNLIDENLGKDSFLAKNKVKDISSVFPATTTAATISVMTGLTPYEHCWLGWDMYIKSIDKTVAIFRNVLKDTHTQAADYNVAQKEFAYTTIFDKINESTNAKAHCVSPFGNAYYNPENPDEMYDKIIELCQNDEKNFIYAYCIEPDSLMHRYGTKDERVRLAIKSLNQKTEQLCDKLGDTLIIVTADHGHIDATGNFFLSDYPQLVNMLVRETSIEPTAVNFFVKAGMSISFKSEFERLFGKHFILFSKDEIISKNLFGSGTEHKNFASSIGDFIAVSKNGKAIFDTSLSKVFKGLHAGLSKNEMTIPLIIIDKK